MKFDALKYSFSIAFIIGFSLAPVSFADELAANTESSKYRISRPAEESIQFHCASNGMSHRWWRKFKNPSFCPYVLCAGSCADISGIPRIGSYSAEQLDSDITPCSLDSISTDGSERGCCMNKSIDKALNSGSADGSCCANSCQSKPSK